VDSGGVRSSGGEPGFSSSVLSDHCQLVSSFITERQRPSQRNSSGDRVDGEELFVALVVDEAVVDLAVDAGVGVLGFDGSERRMKWSVFGNVEKVGGRLEEGIEIVGVGDLDVYDGFGLGSSDLSLVRTFGSGPNVETVKRSTLAVQHVEVVGSSPNHQKDEISDSLGFGFKKIVLIAGLDPVLDVDGTVVTLNAHPDVVRDNVSFSDAVLRNCGRVRQRRELQRVHNGLFRRLRVCVDI